jgi:hypothetical protein
MDVLPLVGYMDEPYARRFLTKKCALPEGAAADVDRLIRRCQAAARARGTRGLEAEIIDLPEDAVLSQVRKDERIQAIVKGRAWSLAQVEIDSLVSIQKYVNSTYADAISRSLDLAKPDDRIAFCFTDGYAGRDSELFEARRPNVFAIKSEGTDLRVVASGATREPGTGATKVSFTVGWGHPFAVVARLGGRYVLNNGYHRAYALRKKGVKHLPCLLVDIDAYGDLECAGPPGLFGPDSILGEHPPTFSAFFDKEISPAVKMRPSSTAVVIRPTVTTLDSDAIDGYFSSQTRVAEQPSPVGMEYVDVRPKFEDWSVYLLDDGTTLRIRAVITRARRRQDGALGEAVVSEPLWVTNAPKGRKGQRSQAVYSAEELNAAIVQRDIGFGTVREPVNEYVTDEGERILLALRLVNISKTGRFDANGDAIYVFSTARDVTLA